MIDASEKMVMWLIYGRKLACFWDLEGDSISDLLLRWSSLVIFHVETGGSCASSCWVPWQLAGSKSPLSVQKMLGMRLDRWICSGKLSHK